MTDDLKLFKRVTIEQVEEGHELDEASVMGQCQEAMAKYKVPKQIISLESFPLAESPNGYRVQRNKLRELAEERLGGR